MTIPSKHQRQLDEEGYVVIPEVLSVAEIASYRARLLELAAAERADGSGRVHSEGRGQHVRWLVNKGREFERLVAHPMVVPYFEHLQGRFFCLMARPGTRRGRMRQTRHGSIRPVFAVDRF